MAEAHRAKGKMGRNSQSIYKSSNDMRARTMVMKEAPSMSTMDKFDNTSGRRTVAEHTTPVCIKKKMQKHSIDVRFHESFAQNHSSTFSNPNELTDEHDTLPIKDRKKRFSSKPVRSNNSKGQLSHHAKVETSSDVATCIEDDPESRQSISIAQKPENYGDSAATAVHPINNYSDSVEIPDITIFLKCTNKHNSGIHIENHVTSSLWPSIDLQEESSSIDSECNRISTEQTSKLPTLKEYQSHINEEQTAEHTTLQSGLLDINENSCLRRRETLCENFQSPEKNVMLKNALSALLKHDWHDPDDLNATNDVWKDIVFQGYELHEIDDFEPIPYRNLAAGALVDADGHGCSDQRIFSPTGDFLALDTSDMFQLEGTFPHTHLRNNHSSAIKAFCLQSPATSGKRCMKKQFLLSSPRSKVKGSCGSDAHQVDSEFMTSICVSRPDREKNKLSLKEATGILARSKKSGASSVASPAKKPKASHRARAERKVNVTARHWRTHREIDGLDDHLINDMLMSPVLTYEDEETGLIPYQLMAAGVSVDADQHLLTNGLTSKHDVRSMTDLFCESVQPKLSQQKKTQILANNHKNCKKAGRKRKVAPVTAEIKPKSRRTELVGPDSWQMAVVFRMVVYLEETAVENESLEKIEKIHIAIDHCKANHAKRSPKYLHLPGAVFEELVNLLGGPEFLHLYKSAKNFHHPRLEEVRSRQLSATNIRLISKKIISNEMNATPNLIQIAIAYGWYLSTKKNMQTADSAMVKDAFEQGSLLILQMSEETRANLWNKIVLNDNH